MGSCIIVFISFEDRAVFNGLVAVDILICLFCNTERAKETCRKWGKGVHGLAVYTRASLIVHARVSFVPNDVIVL